MSILDWAEQECRIACKKENPNFKFDSNDFDYGCSCYKSALKAYRSLCDDGHSGASFGITKSILHRLMDGLPLTAITEDDFKVGGQTEHPTGEYAKYLAKRGLKSEIQCPRMSSLFRNEYLDGRIEYVDNHRAYYEDIEDPSDTFISDTSFIDKMFPIKLPYFPNNGRYIIHSQQFLVNKEHGDFDVRGILYVTDPDGNDIEIGIYRRYDCGKWHDITEEEYFALLQERLDPPSYKVSSRIMWTLISNSADEEEILKREAVFSQTPQDIKDNWYSELEKRCEFFDDPAHYKYNTFHLRQCVCKGKVDEYNDIPEIVEISRYLSDILIYIKSKYHLLQNMQQLKK